MNKLLNRLSKINFIANNGAALLRWYNHARLSMIDFEYEKAVNPSISKEALLDYNRNRKFTVDKNICFAPQKSIFFSFDGSVYLCCENKSDSIGDVTRQSLHDIWFGEQRKFLDEQINKNYNLSYGCNNCNYKIHNKNYSTVQAQNFDLYTHNRSEYPARLEFEIHNTCNLECVMCTGAYSSSIQANRNQMPAIPMVYSPAFVEQLEEFLPHIKSINLLGGEPTLIKIYYDIIQKVQEINPSCFIHLQTNASSVNKRWKSLVEKGNFEIGISIDALTKEKAETIRKNLDFDQFMETVHYYLELYNRNQIKLTINTCVMPENWEEIVPIIRFCNQHKLTIFFCVVNAPYYNTFISTTNDFIDHVDRELTRELETLPQGNYFEKNNYRQLFDFLNMLRSWKPTVTEFAENRQRLSGLTNEELFQRFRDRLETLLEHENKEHLVSETIKYLHTQFDPLEETVKKELLINELNMLRDPVLLSSEKEFLKWTQEYIGSMVFSYNRRQALT